MITGIELPVKHLSIFIIGIQGKLFSPFRGAASGISLGIQCTIEKTEAVYANSSCTGWKGKCV